jgi:hypothetical protein
LEEVMIWGQILLSHLPSPAHQFLGCEPTSGKAHAEGREGVNGLFLLSFSAKAGQQPKMIFAETKTWIARHLEIF